MNRVEADYRFYSDDVSQLLRSIDAIREEMAFQITWNDNGGSDISLNQNPHLLYQLIRCKNLVDEKGKASAFPAIPPYCNWCSRNTATT